MPIEMIVLKTVPQEQSCDVILPLLNLKKIVFSKFVISKFDKGGKKTILRIRDLYILRDHIVPSLAVAKMLNI